jgi:hypothetical protein
LVPDAPPLGHTERTGTTLVRVLTGTADPVKADVLPSKNLLPSKALDPGTEHHHTQAVPNPDRATTNPNATNPDNAHTALPNGVPHPDAVPDPNRIHHATTHPNGTHPDGVDQPRAATVGGWWGRSVAVWWGTVM